MKHILLDTNVVLDFIGKRQPHYPASLSLINKGLHGKVKLYICASTVSNGCYIYRKNTREAINGNFLPLLQWCTILPMDKEVLKAALESNFTDIEDGIVHFSAIIHASQVQYLVTRNGKHFKHSQIQVVTPKEMLMLM